MLLVKSQFGPLVYVKESRKSQTFLGGACHLFSLGENKNS